MKTPVSSYQAEPLAALPLSPVLVPPDDQHFDDLAHLAAYVCGAPIAAIFLSDQDREWFPSKLGLSATETSHVASFCAHALLERDLLLIPDACADTRFADNSLVTSKRHIRFFAGVPLTTSEGLRLGVLCVMDTVPRQLDAGWQDALKRLARQAVAHLTERKQGLQRLIEAQRIGQIGDWEWDIATQVITWSPQVFTIVGRDPSLGSPRDYEENAAFYDAASKALMTEKVTLAIESGEPQDYDLVMHRPNGEQVDVQGRAVPKKDESGRVLGLYGTIQDISVHKRAEAALKESEFRYHSLFENMLEGYARCRALFEQDRLQDLVYLEVNSAFEKLTGLKDVVGKKISDVLPGVLEDNRELLEMYGRVASTGKPEKCETHVEPLGIWLSITAYSHEKEHFVAVFEDITARKQSETVLRESEYRYRALFEFSPLPMWVVDEKTYAFLAVNEAAIAHYGYSEEEFLDMAVPEVLVPEEMPQFLIRFAHNFTAIQPGTARHRKKDGTIIEVEIRSHRLHFNGRAARLAVFTDVTQRNRAKEELEAKNREIITTWESMTDGFFTIDTQWRFTYLNSQAAFMLQAQPEELLGKILWDVFPEAVNTMFYREYHRAVKEQVKVDFEAFYPPLKAWREVHAYPSASGLSVYFRDITLRKHAEEALQKEREFLAALVENISDGIVACDANGVITLFNSATRHFHGLPAQPISADHWAEYFDIYLPDGKTRMTKEQIPLFCALQEGSVRNVEMVIAPKDGARHLLLASGQAIFDVHGEKSGAVVAMHDITESKRDEEALREAEWQQRQLAARLAEAQAIAKVGSWETDLSTMAVRWSAETYRIFEVDPNQGSPTHQGFLQIVHPEDRAAVDEAFVQSLEQSGACEIEHRLLLADGRIKFVEERWQPFKDDAGNLTHVLGTCQDITDRKQTEQNLALRDKAIQASSNGIVVTDMRQPDMPIVFVNPAFERMTGYFANEILGRNCRFLQGKDRDQLELSSIRAALGAGHSAKAVLRNYRKDGTLFWNELLLSPIYDAQGMLTHYVGIQNDVTKRKQAEEERDRFFTLSLDMLAIISSDGYIKRLNPAFEATLGFSNAELMAKPFLEFVHPDDLQATLAEMANLESGILVKLFENRYICRDGSYKWLRWMCAPYEDLWYCVAHDVTEVKQTAVALRQANDELESRVRERTVALESSHHEMSLAKQAAEAANKSKSEFLSRMSHELRTPLNAILGFGQILREEELTTLQKESVHYIVKSGRHLLDLINEVLDIARVEAGKSELSIEPVSVAEVVQECCALVSSLAALQEIRLIQDLALLDQTHVLADRQRLKQVLLNLLSNAIKYNRPGGEVEVCCTKNANDRVCIAVRDTGPGIASEDLPKLFTPFERLGAANSAIEGTGLGLAVSLRMVTAMGGTLEAASVLEHGSTFSIALPCATPPEAALADSAERWKEEPFRKRPERDFNVLCIEDNLSNLRLLEVILTCRPEVTLLAAMQGSVGLDLARQHQPDLILLDLNLPDMSGKEVLAHLQQSALTRAIPVIIISADATPSQSERLLAAGAKAFLTKPLNVTEFLKVLDQTLQAGVFPHVS